jgi:hypothetical protein
VAVLFTVIPPSSPYTGRTTGDDGFICRKTECKNRRGGEQEESGGVDSFGGHFQEITLPLSSLDYIS